MNARIETCRALLSRYSSIGLARLHHTMEITRDRFAGLEIGRRVRERARRYFEQNAPPLSVSYGKPSMLVVLMAGTTVSQYEQAGQAGRLVAALMRYARQFQGVTLVTCDRTEFSHLVNRDRVSHLRLPLPGSFLGPGALLAGALIHARTMRNATSVLVLDEEAAPAGLAVARISGACVTMSLGSPWSPPRQSNHGSKLAWLTRFALRRVDTVVQWPQSDPVSFETGARSLALPDVVDTDLYCPLTTTDPEHPRTVGIFIDSSMETASRLLLGVAERLARRGSDCVLRVVVCGERAESRVASLEAERDSRGLQIEIAPMPHAEMQPGLIVRMRFCLVFNGVEASQQVLRAMASGVPVIHAMPNGSDEGAAAARPAWRRYVIGVSTSEGEITETVEMLFREPGVRLRLAREGRRFAIANHSIGAVSTVETGLLRSVDSADLTGITPGVGPRADPPDSSAAENFEDESAA